MNLENIVGNTEFKQSLSAALAVGRLSHSILLCGEAGTGTGFAARCLAADYLYPNSEHAANAIIRGEGAECITVEGEGASGDIKIEAVRNMRREIYNTSLSANGRCVIIRGAQNLNASSANALLKVLEEPPENVLFILTATSEAAVMATIRSRCSAYSLAPVGEDACAEWINANVQPLCKDAKMLAAVFGGRIGLAKHAAQDASAREVLDKALQIAKLSAKGDEYSIGALLCAYEKDKPGALRLFDNAAAVFSACMRGAIDIGVPKVLGAAALPCLARAAGLLQRNVSAKLALAMLAAELV
ncbi:MAG: hypothetical protein RR848_04680 [Oscillospiraceae bacterium]